MTPAPAPPPERFEFTLGFAAAITLFAAFLSFLLFALLAQGGEPSPATLGFSALAGYTAMFAVAAPRLPPPPRLALGLVAPPARAWPAILLLLPASLLLSEVDNWVRVLIPPPESPERAAPGPVELVQIALVHVIALPAAEEIFFRGMIQPRLVERSGVEPGVVATALLSAVPVLPFGLIWSGALTLCEALVLCAVRHLTGSTIASLVLHACYGGIVVAATMGAFGIPGFDDLGAPHTPAYYLAPAAVSVVVAFLLLRGLREEI
jgi:membrane protease YdiL (CAAX protease family)